MKNLIPYFTNVGDEIIDIERQRQLSHRHSQDTRDNSQSAQVSPRIELSVNGFTHEKKEKYN